MNNRKILRWILLGVLALLGLGGWYRYHRSNSLMEENKIKEKLLLLQDSMKNIIKPLLYGPPPTSYKDSLKLEKQRSKLRQLEQEMGNIKDKQY